ncbi:hypothetical protein, partial [Geofilum rubicundum]|uniref:hypothetical protein n=1 Tax=Geofilum rubicundum TaxID=472113 RepID=UPI001D0DD605
MSPVSRSKKAFQNILKGFFIYQYHSQTYPSFPLYPIIPINPFPQSTLQTLSPYSNHLSYPASPDLKPQAQFRLIGSASLPSQSRFAGLRFTSPLDPYIPTYPLNPI